MNNYMCIDNYTHADSPFVSRWYKIFCSLGYPQLDIVKYEDGEWHIIEMENSPLIPSQCRWKAVLKGLRNIEITEGFIANYIKQIDPMRKAFWEREKKKEEELDLMQNAREEHAKEFAEKAHEAIVKNEGLMDRIARNGLSEMNLPKIANNIDPWKMRGLEKGAKST